jgi:hypothetical protein
LVVETVSVAKDCSAQPCSVEDRPAHVTAKEACLSFWALLDYPVDMGEVCPAQVALPEGYTPEICIAKIGTS